MANVMLKDMKKKLLAGILPPVIITVFIIMIVSIWPGFKDEIAAFQEILENPVYIAFLGQLGLTQIDTFQGFFYMYIFSILEMMMIFLTMIIPTRMVTAEVDKRTLDVTLSYPLSRWRYLLEKFSVYLIFNLLYPILIFSVTITATKIMNETMDFKLLTYTLIGEWLLFFTLGAIALLCGAIFLEGKKALTAAGGIIVGMWILVRVGTIVDWLNFIRYISIFNYLHPATIITEGIMPLDELFIVLGIGVVSLIGALVIFEKRELAII
jgi:ABC-2 type transport system permease protein